MKQLFKIQTAKTILRSVLTLALFVFAQLAMGQTITIGTGTSNTNGTGWDPVADYYNYNHYQVVWTAAELTTAGLTSGDLLNSMGFSVTEAPGTLNNFTIRMGHTTNANLLTYVDPSGFSTVKTSFSYVPTVQTVGNFDMISFDANFSWDGTSNIIIDVCTGSNPYSTPYGGVRYTTATNMSRYVQTDGSSNCGNPATTTSGNRANVQFGYTTPSGCTGLPAAATVAASSASGCNGGTFTLTGSGLDVDAGISHIWQSSTDDVTFADIAGATSGSYSPAVLAGVTYYRLSTTCSNSAQTNYSTSVSFEGLACGSENLPVNGSGNVACGTNTYVYDSGGPSGDYASSSDGYVVLENSGTGIISISGSWSYLEGGYDYLRVFSGVGTGGTEIYTYNGSSGGVITSFSSNPGESITIQLDSDGSANGDGFEIAATYSGTCASCSDLPTALTTSSITASGVTVSWTAPSPAPTDGYDIFFAPDGGSAPTGGSSPTFQTFSGTDVDEDITPLMASTDYEFWVRSDCGSGDVSTWVAGGSLTTLCAPEIAPYIQSFDGTSIPTCWSQSAVSGGPWVFGNPGIAWNTSGCSPAPTENTGNGGNMATMDFSTPDQEVVLQMVDVDVSTLTTAYLEFDYFMCDNPAANELHVEAWDGSAWVLVDANTAGTAGVWQTFGFDISGNVFNTSIVRIRFRGEDHGGGNIFWGDAAIDNVSIIDAPACPQLPSALASSGVTTTSATISWAAAAPAPGTGYDYYVSTTITNPTSGSTPTGQTVGADVDDVVTVSSGTDYYYWVRSDCGGGDVSSWVGPGTFATPATCPVTNATYCYEDATTEWVNVLVVNSGDYLDITFNSGTVENTYDPLLVYDGADGTGTQLYFGYGASGNISGLTYQSTTGVISFAVAGDAFGISCGDGSETQIDYSVVCSAPPPCVAATSLAVSVPSSTSAEISWTGAGDYIVEYGPVGFTPGIAGTAGGGTIASSTAATPYTLNPPLTAGQEYDVYVRQVCSGPAYSVNTGPETFTTPVPCPVTNATYCYENSTTEWVTVLVVNSGDYLDITFNSGTVENNFDELLVYDGADGTGTQLYYGYGASGNISGLTYQSTTGVISFAVQGDGSNSCGSAGQTQIDYSVVCSAPPACPQLPTALTSSALTTTSATISWTAPTPAPSDGYDYYVATTSTDPTSGSTPTGQTIAADVDDVVTVLSGTTYYYWVRSDCGGGDVSSWVGPETFFTPCAVATVPFFDGFETDYTQNFAVAGCWSQESTNGTQVWTANDNITSYNRAPRTGSWNTFLQYSNDDWLFYPVQLTSGTSYTFDVYARQDGGTSTNADITLAYGTTGTAAGMTNTVVAATGIINGGYQLISGAFTPTASGVYYVGIQGSANGSPWYISLDDVSVIETPSCSDLPSALTSSAVTTTSATISWTAPAPAPSDGYDYYVSTTSTNPTSGTTATGQTVAGDVDDDLSSLTSGTTYYYWVRSDCGAGNVSTWVGPETFSTLPSCGDVVSGLCYSQTSTLEVLVSFTVATPGDFATLTFLAGGVETCCDEVVVYDGPNGTGNIIYGSLSGGGLSDYSSEGTVTSATGTISLAVNSDGSATCSGVGYTSFEVELNCIAPPACPDLPSALASSGVTTTSATISWAAATPAPSDGYDYYVSTTSTDPTSGTTPTGQTVGADVDDVVTVSSGTDYYYWVRSDCGGGDVSTWVGPGTFTTTGECPVTNATYCYDNSTTEWVTVLVVNPGDYLDITFNSGTVENTWDELLVYDGADGTGTQLYYGYGASGNISGLTYQSLTGVISFAVQGDGSNSCGDGGETEINYSVVCSAPPACLAATSLAVSVLSSTSAEISWTGAGDHVVEYGPVGFTPGIAGTAGGGTIASSTAATPYTLNPPLTAGQEYDVYVRQVCSGPSYSVNTGPETFTTPVACPVTNATYCYANSTTEWVNVLVATSGDYLDITFNSGTVENGWDELLVYDGADGTGTQLYYGYGASGNISGLTYQSLTGVISFAVQADGSNSCGTSQQTQIDYSVVCSAPPTCLVPTNLAVSDVTFSSATLDWDASPSSPSGGYEWELRTSGAGGSGATGLTDNGVTGAGVTTDASTALSGATSYGFYLRANCGGGDFSTWEGPSSFGTLLVNDECSDAIALACGTTGLTGTTVGSVVESPSTPWFMSNYGVWYTFEGNGFDITVSVDADASYDHELGIGSGDCGSITNVSSVDNAGGGGTENYTVSNSTPGLDYYVYVGHYSTVSSSTGSFTVSLTCDVDVWTGDLDPDWGTNGNWSDGSVPTSSENVLVPNVPSGGNFPMVNGDYSIFGLYNDNSATMDIGSGSALTVNGELRNNGTFNVASGGSLVQTLFSSLAGSGTFNVSRVGSSNYDYWSFPIAVASTSQLGPSGVYTYDPQLGTADELDDQFDPGWVTAGSNAIPGKGYAGYGNVAETFTGTVNNGSVAIGIEYFSNPDPTLGGVAYNLIGNPYPSGVDAADFLFANQSRLAEATIWYWDDAGAPTFASADYATWNLLGGTSGGGGNVPTGVIGSAQGFKVKASSTGSVQFSNSMRVATNTSILFRQAEVKKLWLSATNTENLSNQLLVGFTEDGTDGVDWGYDGTHLNPQSDLSFYSLIDGAPYAIQGYGPLDAQRIVPLGFVSGLNTSVTFTLDTLDNMEDDDIILEDRYLDMFTDMHLEDYTFQSGIASYQDRFFLHFTPLMVTGVRDDALVNNFTAFVNNDLNLLNLQTGTSVQGNLDMLDMSGRLVWSRSNVTLGQTNSQFDISGLSKGVYVVRLTSVDGMTVSQKVMK